jgi:hypothetical protein
VQHRNVPDYGAKKVSPLRQVQFSKRIPAVLAAGISYMTKSTKVSFQA